MGILIRDQATALVRRAFGAIPNPRRFALDYDRTSDILLVNRATDRAVGLQTDGLLTELIHCHPDLANILAVAYLDGITRKEGLAAADHARRQEPQVAVSPTF